MRKIIGLLLLLPGLAHAGIADDYASQWPLNLSSDDGGAYRVSLDRSVYRQLQMPGLEDMDVVNADGVVVASALFGPQQPVALAAGSVEVGWFPLPDSDSLGSADIAAISELATDGSLRRIEWRRDQGGAATAPPGNGYLIDLSRLREPIAALQFEWTDTESFELAYRLAVSDDLKTWRELAQPGRLLQLQNRGQRIVEARVELEGVRAKYLRLIPVQPRQRALRLARVSAQLPPHIASPEWQWEALTGHRTSEHGIEYFEFELPGRFPIQQVDVALAGNRSNQWSLYSRDNLKMEWQLATAPWLAYQLQAGGASSRSQPQALPRVSRHRYWRLKADHPIGEQVPGLRLGYRPEVVVFLAQGSAPYRLLAGSLRARRSEATVAPLLEALRGERGADWQPAPAYLGPEQALAGARALQPVPVPVDWKRWLLWLLLGGGSALVAGLAISLLRKSSGSAQ